MWPRDKATFGGVGLCRWESTCEERNERQTQNNQKEMGFQMNDSVLICKIWPRCYDHLWTERRLLLPGMSATVCLRSSRHGANNVPEHVGVHGTAPSWQCQRAHSSRNSGLSSRQWCSAGHPPTILIWLSPPPPPPHPPPIPVTGFCSLLSRRSWRESSFRAWKIPLHSSRESFSTYASRRGRVSQAAGLRGWQNVCRLKGGS